jgi:predicted nucleotidyltransferase component of viral defense system
MHEAIRSMLDDYGSSSLEDYRNALRDILQRLALLGLWRSRFFQHAAFYGGTALRMLHGLDRFSEDLDFSLLTTDRSFSMEGYADALRNEIAAFGFHVEFERSERSRSGRIDSAFLKADTCSQLIAINVGGDLLRDVHPGKLLKIRLEVDTDPPAGFRTEMRYVFRPIAFPVRIYSLPDLFAGKLHAVLCRRWRTRVKGRDWYDMVWYAGHHPEIRIGHLEERMRQSGDYHDDKALSISRLQGLLRTAIVDLDLDQAREETSRFVRDPRVLDVWSKDFFHHAIERIRPV